ncbi:Gfo/Idh/MocA family oxidoreductase [Halioxenophilus sp. WMMB6]|uniref:Gfo/Idh/MocA family protein n=1 Tax=Halioxenophilus sp. WMMB6 TaxID=3073815 RepID=UPI00295E66D3|nr:Gfo/Idh/MocA family oxidoreductase [Halioxenophilus sp. WMMB6]
MITRETPHLKLAFIGGGCNSAVGYAHYSASHLDGCWQLVAGAFSRHNDINELTARQYGLPPERVYDDWRQLLAECRTELDAVAILTPTPAHQDMVCAALDAGLTVICEKSLTDSVASAEAIKRSLKASDGRLLVTYNYSGYPMVRELRKRVRVGQLGRIRHMHLEMPQEGFARLLENGEKPSPQPWRLQDGTIATLHLDLTTHLHHLAYYLTGKRPLRVLADHNTFGWFDSVVDDATALVDYEDDLHCRYWVSKSALGYKNGLSLRVMGDRGSALWLQTEPEQLQLNFVDGRREIVERGGSCLVANEGQYNRFKAGHPSGFIEAFANLYRDFATAVVSQRQNKISTIWKEYGIEPAQEGLHLMEVMGRSHASQQWEVINERCTTVRNAGTTQLRDHLSVADRRIS